MIQMRSRPHSYGACLALILFLSGCERPAEQPTGFRNQKTEFQFPITRTLTDNTGRPLEATIIGRDATSITVIRKSDGSRFDIPNSKLSNVDQTFVAGLPLRPAARLAPVSSSTQSGADGDRGVLSFHRIRLKELEEQIRKNDNIIDQIGPTTMKGRSLSSENSRLIRERAELVEEIAELETR